MDEQLLSVTFNINMITNAKHVLKSQRIGHDYVFSVNPNDTEFIVIFQIHEFIGRRKQMMKCEMKTFNG